MKKLCDCDGGNSIGGNEYLLTQYNNEFIQKYLKSIQNISEYYFIVFLD